MRFSLVLFSILLFTCKQKTSPLIEAKQETVVSSNERDTVIPSKKEQRQRGVSFKNISEIIADSTFSIWVQKQGSNFSLALHFQNADTLVVSYSPDCWLFYPYELEKNKIVVYWSNFMDTKYQSDLIKAIKKSNEEYLGEPFMILELSNDTTLKATYLLKDFVKELNNSAKSKVFFPDEFYIVHEGELYD